MNLEINSSIHNRFDIEVIDVNTGKIKLKATAFNVICNGFWDTVINFREHTSSNRLYKGWAPRDTFRYIHYGRGTGTPTVSDTTLFDKIDAMQTNYYNWNYDRLNNVVSLTRYITINSDVSVGESISEVGISGSTSSIYTHAMLTDINGNTISILKTSTDIINIYATIYIHFNTSYQNGDITVEMAEPSFTSLFSPYTAYSSNYDWVGSIFGAIMGYTNASTYGDNQTVRLGFYKGTLLTLKAFEYTDIGTGADSTTKTVSYKVRIDLNTLNFNGIKKIGFNIGYYGYQGLNVLMFHARNNGLIPTTTITNESLGTGDGITTNFNTKFPIDSNLEIYIDGILTNDFTYRTGPISSKDMIYSFNRIEIIDNIPTVVFNSALDTYSYYDYNGSSGTTPYISYFLNNYYCTTGMPVGYGTGKYMFWNCIIENPYYTELGFYKFNSLSRGDKDIPITYGSNDGLNWTKIADYSDYISTGQTIRIGNNTHTERYYELPVAYRNFRYIKFVPELQATANSWVGFTYTPSIEKNIYFNNPPSNGSVILVNYKSDSIAKDSDHVLDLEWTISFNEYQGA